MKMKFLVPLAIASLSTLALPSLAGAQNTLYAPGALHPTAQSSASLTTGRFTFSMQWDCNLVLYDGTVPIWATNTVGCGDRVWWDYSGWQWDDDPSWPGAWIETYTTDVIARLQGDGNFVVYATYKVCPPGQPNSAMCVVDNRTRVLFATGTNGHSDVRQLIAQTDGNVVIYDRGGHAFWATNTRR